MSSSRLRKLDLGVKKEKLGKDQVLVLQFRRAQALCEASAQYNEYVSDQLKAHKSDPTAAEFTAPMPESLEPDHISVITK